MASCWLRRWRFSEPLLLLALTLALAPCAPPARAAAPPPPALQALIDATPAHGTLRLPAGTWRGPARIDKPITLDGGGHARLQGNGEGSVLTVSGEGVVVRGLAIGGSGASHDAVDAGIVVEGHHHRIEHNRLDDVLFGIHLRGADDNLIAGNLTRGKDLSLGMRGDGLRIWNGRRNRVDGNTFERLRDITLTNAPDNRLVDNRIRDGRYALQAIFSPRLVAERNDFAHTGTGIVILYSPEVSLRGNRIAHARDGGGAGITFKESDTGLVEDNDIIHCAVGLKVDAPPEPQGTLVVRRNRFAHNSIALSFYGEAGGHHFEGNRFENNLATVAISAPGAGARNTWRHNVWDDYEGFDRDGDGIGDTPHEVWLFADRLWMEIPLAGFFRASPVLELLDFLERLAPFMAPYRVLHDPAPRMR